MPNHLEYDVLQIDIGLTHDYDKCLIKSSTFYGYICVDDFCEWLFTEENRNTTVMAHNGAGYDFKFILQWCITKKHLLPSSFIRQGSRITYMTFEKYRLRFIDSYNFFMEPLKKLSETYKIDTLKGHFPHHFNTRQNQNYIGRIPSEAMFGAKNMMPDNYKEFHEWHKQQLHITDWNFKEELIKYCRADVELLSKAVL